MKKIIMVSGSQRKGNTLGITGIYSEAFTKSGCDVKVIDLSKEVISFCDGCLSCDDTQVCKNNDAMNDYITEILNSDLLVLGTPSRWALLSGELKCFIDRLNPYASCEGYAEKKVFVFALGQSEEENSESIDNAIKSILAFTNDAGMTLVGTRKFCHLLEEEDYKKDMTSLSLLCNEDVKYILKELSI